MIKVLNQSFINDFRIIYYFKNIDFLTKESINFSLNDEEFLKIKEISNKVESQVFILFWQFTVKTVAELDTVSNQNLSVEMFLMRLMYLTSLKKKKKIMIFKNQLKMMKRKKI